MKRSNAHQTVIVHAKEPFLSTTVTGACLKLEFSGLLLGLGWDRAASFALAAAGTSGALACARAGAGGDADGMLRYALGGLFSLAGEWGRQDLRVTSQSPPIQSPPRGGGVGQRIMGNLVPDEEWVKKIDLKTHSCSSQMKVIEQLPFCASSKACLGLPPG